MDTHRKQAFTLIELLVVISIIALLLAILVPVLSQAREQAKATVCLSNLKQWGQITTLYALDNEGSIYQSIAGGGLTAQKAYWIVASLPYYEEKEIRLCPATKVRPGVQNRWYGSTKEAWGPFDPGGSGDWWDDFDAGSYGINDWCADPPASTYWGKDSSKAWRTIESPGANTIPIFGDCIYVDGYPTENDYPPSVPDEYNSWAAQAMKLFCIARHKGAMNMVFLDASARKIGLKELWTLKWHKGYDTTGYWTTPDADWPDWMDGL